jgi:hypothetical protein
MPKRVKAAPARTVRLKGNALAPRKRSGASAQSAPTASPQAAYGRGRGPLPEAYGPPPEAFRGEPLPIDGAISQSVTEATSLAPRPIVDKFPIVIGAGLSFAYLSACQRTALTGYRMQWVDLAREILERDPHLYAVVWKLILGIANGRLEFTPAVLPHGHPDEERAKEVCDDIAYRFKRIRGLKQSIASLGWGAYYGVGAAENHYKLEDDNGWIVTHLGFIHSRRLSYPDMGTWDLYIWDQGQVLSASPYGTSPTNSNMFGLRVADFPQKFVIFAPQISGDYPTREGIARIVLEWALSKRLNARVALQYLERFVKPWPEATYNTADPDSEHPTAPREATTEDIQEASAAMGALGAGGLSSWVHPDSVKIDLKSADEGRPKLTFKEFLEMCNEELSKGAVGSTLTTTGGSHGGNRALGEQHKSEEQNIAGFLAQCMADSLKDQLATPLTLLNHSNAEHIVPTLTIHVGDVDAAAIMKLATDGAASNIPVDADAVAETCGLPVIPRPEGAPARRMIPLDVTLSTDLEPELAPVPGPNTAGGAKLENEKTKAAQPHVMPGVPGAVPTAKPEPEPRA